MQYIWDNDYALADGTGISDDAIIARHIADGAVLPEHLISGNGTSWAWQTWTPSWTNLTVGNGVTKAKYCKIGKTLVARLNLLFGTTTSITGAIGLAVPATPHSDYGLTKYVPIGKALYVDEGSNVYLGTPYLQLSTSSISLGTLGAAGTYVNAANVGVTATVPHTWANTDAISLELMYELP